MKKYLSVILALLLVIAFSASAYAATMISKSRDLTFSGNSAIVYAYLSQSGAECELEVKLFRGGTKIGQWNDSGTGSASVSDSVSGCTSGQSYTLYVTGTVNGNSVYFSPITRTCP